MIKVGDIVMQKYSSKNYFKKRIGIIIQITKNNSTFVYWSDAKHISGYNTDSISERLIKINQ